jgi:hypothetical protein
MRIATSACCAIVLLGSLLSGRDFAAPGAGPADQGLENLVQGVLSRAEAVFSARMEYKQKIGSGIPPKFSSELEMEASFSGSSWVTRCRTTGAVATNHNGKFVRWIKPDPRNGALAVDYLTIKRPEAIDLNYPPAAPYFAGTFWFKITRQYVRDHRHEAVRAGSGEVNGVPVTILEWPVPKSAVFQAFDAVNEFTQNGGILRLFVSTQLGHALPRVEFAGVGGGVADRFDAADFVEVAPGIFIPKRFSEQGYNSEGPMGNIHYEVTRVEKVNEVIPEEDFILQVPRGAIVSDQRSMQHAETFRVGENQVSEPKDIGDLIVSGAAPSKAFSSWPTAVGIGLAVGLLLIGLYYLARRRVRRVSA